MKKKEPKPITMDFFVTTDGFQRNYEMLMKEKSGRGNDALKRAFTETLISNATEHLMRQSNIAKNPRPKKKPTNMSLTIESMKKWRNNDKNFSDFMDAAQNESIENLTLYQDEDDQALFIVCWDGLKEEERKRKTLERWWAGCTTKI